MKRIITVIAALAFLTNCGNYTLIEAKRRDINTFYSVHPQIEWNALRTSNFEVWTVDGVDLAAIYFVKGLKDGERYSGRNEALRLKSGRVSENI